MRRTEIISAAVLVLFSSVVIVAVIPTYVAGGGQEIDLPPAFMPYIAAGTLLLVMIIYGGLRLLRRYPDDELAGPIALGSWLYVAAVVATFVATFVVTSMFGYLAGAPLIVAGFMAIARAKPTVVLGTAIAFPVAIWLFMEKLLGFPLP